MTADNGVVTLGLALIAAIPPTLIALAAYRSSRENSKKADALLTKTDEIHVLTNSTLSQTTAQLAIANEKIAGLEKLIGALANVRDGSVQSPEKPKGLQGQ